MPSIDPTAFIHPLAIVLGEVTMGPCASAWPTAVLRGDGAAITVGAGSNVQDGAVLHVDQGLPCSVGDRVTIGHRAIVHGATVEDDCMIGMGAIVLNRARIGAGSIVAAGAVVPEGAQIPPGSIVMGIPGKVVKPADAQALERIRQNAESYIELQRRHRHGDFPRVT